MRWKTSAILLASFATFFVASTHAADQDNPQETSPRGNHVFDFDERSAGNLEDVPKFWVPLRMPGFPRYATGSFDFNVGASAAPSFALRCEGRNIAYEYRGPDTRVRPNTDYRIEGMVRTQDLLEARACLSAHYADEQGRPIRDTVVRSRYVEDAEPKEDAGGNDEWTTIEMFLPPPPPRARSIGLIAWILQSPQWDAAAAPRRHIPRRDVRGTAWFDDIRVIALPRVELSTPNNANVLIANRPRVLLPLVAHHEDATIFGRLIIRNAAGKLVGRHDIPGIVGPDDKPNPISVDYLPLGLYHAALEVSSDEAHLVTRSLTFVIVDAMHETEQGGGGARPFGVVLDPATHVTSEPTSTLLSNLGVGSAKIPVWSGLAGSRNDTHVVRETSRMLQTLVKTGFSLTGVFAGPPSSIVRRDGAYPRPLLELLTDKPEVWRDDLASVVVAYAGQFHFWQVGSDGGAAVLQTDQLAIAIDQLKTAMRQFTPVPQVTLPMPASTQTLAVASKVDQVTLSFGPESAAESFVADVQRAREQGIRRVSAYVEPLPVSEFYRLPRLAEWARRIILARHAGADAVYVPQPWTLTRDTEGARAAPTEEYSILHTLATRIASASPNARLRFGADVDAYAFTAGDATVLALWDLHAPPQGRVHEIPLGESATLTDLWGRTVASSKSASGKHLIRLSAMPIVATDVPTWLIEWLAGMSLSPGRVQSGTELQHHDLTMNYHGSKPLMGSVRIGAVEDWEVLPRERAFQLQPGSTLTLPFEIRYPHSVRSGRYSVIARLRLDQPPMTIAWPLELRVDLADVDVRGTAVLVGSELVLTHAVTNRSPKALSFRGTANVPGRPRQYRPFADLLPGRTQVVEYRYRNAATLSSATISLALRELNDGPRVHGLSLLVP